MIVDSCIIVMFFKKCVLFVLGKMFIFLLVDIVGINSFRFFMFINRRGRRLILMVIFLVFFFLLFFKWCMFFVFFMIVLFLDRKLNCFNRFKLNVFRVVIIIG